MEPHSSKYLLSWQLNKFEDIGKRHFLKNEQENCKKCCWQGQVSIGNNYNHRLYLIVICEINGTLKEFRLLHVCFVHITVNIVRKGKGWLLWKWWKRSKKFHMLEIFIFLMYVQPKNRNRYKNTIWGHQGLQGSHLYFNRVKDPFS